MPYTVYILRTNKGTLYTGQTSDLPRRLAQHAGDKKGGAKYTRSFSSFELVYTEECATLSEALKREAAIKKLSHSQKEALIKAV